MDSCMFRSNLVDRCVPCLNAAGSYSLPIPFDLKLGPTISFIKLNRKSFQWYLRIEAEEMQRFGHGAWRVCLGSKRLLTTLPDTGGLLRTVALPDTGTSLSKPHCSQERLAFNTILRHVQWWSNDFPPNAISRKVMIENEVYKKIVYFWSKSESGKRKSGEIRW